MFQTCTLSGIKQMKKHISKTEFCQATASYLLFNIDIIRLDMNIVI